VSGARSGPLAQPGLVQIELQRPSSTATTSTVPTKKISAATVLLPRYGQVPGSGRRKRVRTRAGRDPAREPERQRSTSGSAPRSPRPRDQSSARVVAALERSRSWIRVASDRPDTPEMTISTSPSSNAAWIWLRWVPSGSVTDRRKAP
jgi:hypothetical protein